MPTHYEILGVTPTSEQEVIAGAYKALIRKYHPDRAGDNERIRQINAAYSVLKHPIKRRAYDATLKLFPAKDLMVRRAEDRAGKNARGPAPGRLEKKCPDCFENVAQGALVCRYCGHRFVDGGKNRSNPFRAGCGFALALLLLITFLGLLSDGEVAVSNEVSSAEAGACGPDSIELDLGRVEARGTLELLAPKAETDAHNSFIIGLDEGSCVSRIEIDELVRAAGTGGSIELLVGHDPNGTLYDYRSRFAYETDGTIPLADVPVPSADMHFGEAKWDANGKSNRLVVSWYGSFRQWLARKYGNADPTTAAMNGSSALDEPIGEASSTVSGGPKIPLPFRGRWALNVPDCYSGLSAKTITEARDTDRAAGDLTAVNLQSATSADLTFSMADDQGQFSYTERWTASPDGSQLAIGSTDDGEGKVFIRCPAGSAD